MRFLRQQRKYATAIPGSTASPGFVVSGQLVVIPDEKNVDQSTETWSRLGKEIEFAHLQIPATEFQYHYRLTATITLAEISRQVGRRPTAKVLRAGRPPFYDARLARLAEVAGQIVSLEELIDC
jgi:hypothetical protein